MNPDTFFDLFGNIDPRFVREAEAALYPTGRGRREASARRALRTVLLAAALAALLTATAYAAELFGLRARLIPSPPLEETDAFAGEGAEDTLAALRQIRSTDYISLSGVSGSPEYRAAAEWLAFRGDYAEKMAVKQLEKGESFYAWRDLERRFAPDERAKEICRLYQVWDADMWERLQAIAGEYGLALHTDRSPVLGDEQPSRSNGQYEDGSFLVSVPVTLNGSYTRFSLYWERDGALPCDDLTANGTEEYEEWTYTNRHGDTVSIAMRDISQSEFWTEKSFLIFYDGDGVTATVKAMRGRAAAETALSDEDYAEQLADALAFAAAAAAASPEETLRVLRGEA